MIEYAILAGSVGIFILVLLGVGAVVLLRALGRSSSSSPAPIFQAGPGKSFIDLLDDHIQTVEAKDRRAKLEEKAAGLVRDPKAP